jgi:putative flavoprotein involved in K+ transport
MKSYDAIVIGSGQAALAAGYYLQKKGLSYVLLDKENEVGEVWRNRYDSLVLFTPRFYSSLPGLPIEGEDFFGNLQKIDMWNKALQIAGKLR